MSLDITVINPNIARSIGDYLVCCETSFECKFCFHDVDPKPGPNIWIFTVWNLTHEQREIIDKMISLETKPSPA